MLHYRVGPARRCGHRKRGREAKERGAPETELGSTRISWVDQIRHEK